MIFSVHHTSDYALNINNQVIPFIYTETKNSTKMTFIKKTFSTFILLLAGTTVIMAHPGHGDSEGRSLIHYFSEPFHAIPLILVIAIAAGVIFMAYSKLKKQSTLES